MTTQLYIAGTEAVLPQDFAITLKRENPLFTKSGEYTYDITLRLDNAVNRSLYGFLHRLNRRDQLPTERIAMLMADGHVYVRGKEVITSWTDQTVSIQLLAGNADLNFILGSDVTMEELDMGTLSDANYNRLRNQPSYPESDYCLPPLITPAGQVFNLEFSNGIRYAPQPFLCPVIERLMAALGYTVGTNQLADTCFADLFLVSTVMASDGVVQLSQCFAGWTAADFISEIEKLTGAVFVVDNERMTVDILLRSTFYTTTRQVTLNNVIDEYKAEIIDEGDELVADFSNSSISYDLPSHRYANLLRLPTEVKNEAAVSSYSSIDEMRNAMDTIPAIADTLLEDQSTGRLYVVDYAEEGDSQLLEVDLFVDYERTGAATKLELAFTPAPLAYVPKLCPQEIIDLGQAEYSGDGITDESTEETTTAEDTKDFVDRIRSFTDNKASRSDIYCAFYSGDKLHTLRARLGNQPFVYTDHYHLAAYCMEHFTQKGTEVDISASSHSLRLEKLVAEVEHAQYQIDTTQQVTISTFDPNTLDPRWIIVAGNRRYVVRDIEESVTAQGRSPQWKVTAHPISITDAALEKKWVLTQGTWDDGAAWLDDGRWNDE